jgi:hypothetical protein
MTATSSPDDHLGPPEERRTDERDQRPEMLAAGYDAPPWTSHRNASPAARMSGAASAPSEPGAGGQAQTPETLPGTGADQRKPDGVGDKKGRPTSMPVS